MPPRPGLCGSGGRAHWVGLRLTRLALSVYSRRTNMTWTKPEFEIVELGMEVGAYAGSA